jgi:hypothetical protein
VRGFSGIEPEDRTKPVTVGELRNKLCRAIAVDVFSAEAMQTFGCVLRGTAKVIVATVAEAAGVVPDLNTMVPETLVLPGASVTLAGDIPAPGPAEIRGTAEFPMNCEPENTVALSPADESAFAPLPTQINGAPITHGEKAA